MNLGIALNLPPALLGNIDDDHNSNERKAYAVLLTWMERKGTAATMGSLADALVKIGKHNIVQKLIGMQPFLVCLFLFFQ